MTRMTTIRHLIGRDTCFLKGKTMEYLIEERNYGWLYHLDGCKAYNEAVFEFPHYECMCHYEAAAISDLIRQMIMAHAIRKNLDNYME